MISVDIVFHKCILSKDLMMYMYVRLCSCFDKWKQVIFDQDIVLYIFVVVLLSK